MTSFQEIRWHGRGGQGAMTASDLLAKAAMLENKYVQSFPEFGPERMGAPIRAFTRISNKPINLHCTVSTPHIVVVLDPTLLKTIPVTEGLQKGGTLIVNSRETSPELLEQTKLVGCNFWIVSATEIAVKISGLGITNTAMLGAFARAVTVVKLSSLEQAIKGRFPPKISERNLEILGEAYREAKLA
jgi:2-oxoacid:acceptor oxidoreductase gamma subunit (pyruvate/2-ketoisovalerate family)